MQLNYLQTSLASDIGAGALFFHGLIVRRCYALFDVLIAAPLVPVHAHGRNNRGRRPTPVKVMPKLRNLPTYLGIQAGRQIDKQADGDNYEAKC